MIIPSLSSTRHYFFPNLNYTGRLHVLPTEHHHHSGHDLGRDAVPGQLYQGRQPPLQVRALRSVRHLLYLPQPRSNEPYGETQPVVTSPFPTLRLPPLLLARK